MIKVIIGLLGPTLDRGTDSKRWNHWRPSVSLFQHEDLLIDRFELLYQPRFEKLLHTVVGDIHSISPETEIRTHEIQFNNAWDFEEVYSVLHDFTIQYDFNTDQEEYLIHISTGTHVSQICMFLLTESRHFPGKLIQSSPSTRKIESMVGTYTTIDLDLSKYDRIAERFVHERSESVAFLKSGIDTCNKQFNHIIEQIEHVAIHSKDCILLSGPTGAGKSHLAKKIFELKRMRRQIEGPFVEVNCATLRGDAALSALFGHKKGAFTGALQDRQGLLRQANQGLLFLDEIGEMGIDEQTMLLRALEEKSFLPMGADHEVESNFQLICGTNRNLIEEVGQGNFREDLLARINLWNFRLPGLQERREDIEPNIQYELMQNTIKTGKQIRFNKEALRIYLQFAKSPQALWSYNFRDLSASISRMVTMAPSGRITVEVVRDEIARLTTSWCGTTKSPQDQLIQSIVGEEEVRKIDRFDLPQLQGVIRVCLESNSLSEAGRILFDQSRRTRSTANDSDRLRKYLLKYNLSWKKIKTHS